MKSFFPSGNSNVLISAELRFIGFDIIAIALINQRLYMKLTSGSFPSISFIMSLGSSILIYEGFSYLPGSHFGPLISASLSLLLSGKSSLFSASNLAVFPRTS